jgi:uncharacterized repeat protein (TIGR01451 family)
MRRTILLLSTMTIAVLAVSGALLFGMGKPAQAQSDPEPPCTTTFCLDKTADPNPATVGEPITFTITQRCPNTSPPAFCHAGFPLVDELPSGLTVDSVDANAPMQPNYQCTTSGNIVTCAEAREFSATQPFTLTIVATPTTCGAFTNTASAGPNSGKVTFTVVGCGVRLSPGDDVYQEQECPPEGDETVFARGGDDTLLLNECGDTDNEPDPSDSDVDVARGQGGNDNIRVDDGDIQDTARGGSGTDRCTGDLDLGDGVDDVDEPPIGPGGGTGPEEDVGDTLLCEQKTYVIGEFYNQS